MSLVVLIASQECACPQSRDPKPTLQFDIPSQPLEAALDAYGATSRWQVLYETSLTAGRISAEVRGAYTQEAALQRLLSRSGLSFDYTEEHAFTLVPAQPGPQPEKSRAIADFGGFLGSVQAAVLSALCRQPEVRLGRSRLAMQFTIGASGRLENPNLLSTTGLASRDAEIAGLLARIALGQSPPSGMPQPVTMVLRADAAAGIDKCEEAGR